MQGEGVGNMIQEMTFPNGVQQAEGWFRYLPTPCPTYATIPSLNSSIYKVVLLKIYFTGVGKISTKDSFLKTKNAILIQPLYKN